MKSDEHKINLPMAHGGDEEAGLEETKSPGEL